MLARPAGWDEALTRSHRITTRAEVIRNNSVVTELKIQDGNVHVTPGDGPRRDAELHIVDEFENLRPFFPTDMLHPMSGNEIRLFRGIAGVGEVQLGVFGMEDTEINDSGEALRLQLNLVDRSMMVSRSRFTTMRVVSTNSDLAATIRALIEDVYPAAQFSDSFDSILAGQVTGSQAAFERTADPWASCRKLCRDQGFDLFFNNQGLVDVRVEPDPSDRVAMEEAVSWTYREGHDATILSIKKKVTRAGTFNAVVVNGEPTDGSPAVTATAVDDNPDSPTYYLGPFGYVPWFYASSFIRTTAQAQAVADQLLLQKCGRLESMHFNAIVNPAHDHGDIVKILRRRASLPNGCYYQFDTVTIPLVAVRAMEVTTKQRYLRTS
jgi:hypothetical protein